MTSNADPVRPDDLPSASDWEQAVSRIFNTYPPDIFPPDSDSPDARAGTWARKVCLNIITEAWRFRTERAEAANHRRWHGPEHNDGSITPNEGDGSVDA